MCLEVEGWGINALADSGNHVKMVMPSFVCQHKFPVLLLGDLVDHPLNLIGLGGTRMWPMGFIILRVQVCKIAGYEKDVIFLVIPDEFNSPGRCPICML